MSELRKTVTIPRETIEITLETLENCLIMLDLGHSIPMSDYDAIMNAKTRLSRDYALNPVL